MIYQLPELFRILVEVHGIFCPDVKDNCRGRFILTLCPFRTSQKLSIVPCCCKNCTMPRMWLVSSLLESFRPGVSIMTLFDLLVIQARDISLVVFVHKFVLLLAVIPSTELRLRRKFPSNPRPATRQARRRLFLHSPFL